MYVCIAGGGHYAKKLNSVEKNKVKYKISFVKNFFLLLQFYSLFSMCLYAIKEV